jgi:hypothetical protein
LAAEGIIDESNVKKVSWTNVKRLLTKKPTELLTITADYQKKAQTARIVREQGLARPVGAGPDCEEGF